MKHAPHQNWYDQRKWAATLALLVLIGAYFMGSHALDTGSWQQYGLTFVFLIFGLNRLFRGIWPQKAN